MNDSRQEVQHVTALGPGAPDTGERPRVSRHGGEEDRAIRDFSMAAAQLCFDRHCENITLLDVRGLSSVTDYILIASGTSDRQIRAVAKEIADAGDEHGMSRIGRDEDGDSKWVVLDFVDLVVHLFEPATRAFYDLEMLWGDGKKVGWQR